jgi:hypothetical protein
MKKTSFIILIIFFLSESILPQNSHVQKSIMDGSQWFMNRTDSIGGYGATALTALPTIVSTPYGDAAQFNGTNQALLINNNPLGTATQFTIEVFFRPDSATASINEQRFLHIRNLANDNRRVLMELRWLPSQTWVLDTYIKSDTTATPNAVTIVDSTKTHPVAQWHHVALVYDGKRMHQFVNGIDQIDSTVIYQQIDLAGKTSIGARQDPRSWFKGIIYMVKVTPRALTSAEFTFPVVTGMQRGNIAPKGIELGQNYPNPFNPSTTINYEMPSPGKVSIKVFNVLGKEVGTLAEGYQSAGVHEVKFQNASLPSGTYFCRLQAGDYVSIKKMTLLK